jgi:hypothetical protein
MLRERCHHQPLSIRSGIGGDCAKTVQLLNIRVAPLKILPDAVALLQRRELVDIDI